MHTSFPFFKCVFMRVCVCAAALKAPMFQISRALVNKHYANADTRHHACGDAQNKNNNKKTKLQMCAHYE